jgi:hypothetical protein
LLIGVITMKHTIFGVLGGLLILAGCNGILTGPGNGGNQQNSSAGNLTVRIGYSLSQGRTAYPSHDEGNTPLDYALEFEWTGGGDAAPTHDPVSIRPGVPVSISLEPGSWTVTAKATAGGVEKASGTAPVTIAESGNADITISLNATGDSAPVTGTLSYVLYFPAGAAGSLSLADANGNPAGSPVTTLASGTAGSIPNLSPGSYLVKVSLSKGGETAGRTEAAHIVAGLATKVAYNFYENFASAPTPVNSDTDLAKIGVDDAWPLSGRYALTQNISLSEWTPLGSLTAPFTGSFDGGGNTITINSFAATALSDNQYIGVFAAVKGIPENKARVKNLKLVSSVNIAALSTAQGQGIGLVSGYAEDAVISDINLSGSLNIASFTKVIFAGGAVGDMRKGAELRDCAGDMDMSAANPNTSGVNTPLYTGATSAIGGLVGFFLTSAGGAEYGEGKDALIKNCANSGDVTVSHAANANVPVGGIAGGFVTTSAAFYLGRIEDCVYAGSLSGGTGGYVISGGIAGAIGGNGGDAANRANTSRILRCRTPESAKTIKGIVAAGGIVGYASNALIERCSSSATLESTSTTSNAYTGAGGIAGSIQTTRISDCWSDGIVQGAWKAGGIASYGNSNGATVERCYSRAALSVIATTGFWGVGGILGGGLNGNNVTVTLCVALNDSLSSPVFTASTGPARYKVKRICGGPSTNITGIAINYAPAIPVTGPESWAYDAVLDGTLLEDDPPEPWLYEVTLGWDFDEVWIMGEDGYPRLREVDNR